MEYSFKNDYGTFGSFGCPEDSPIGDVLEGLTTLLVMSGWTYELLAKAFREEAERIDIMLGKNN